MNKVLPVWLMPPIVRRFTSSRRHSMDELMLGTSRWSDRSTRQALETLTPVYSVDITADAQWLEVAVEPALPTPTDVPVPEPFDVPVPEPIDIPPPDPHDVPPPRRRPKEGPRPRSVP